MSYHTMSQPRKAGTAQGHDCRRSGRQLAGCVALALWVITLSGHSALAAPAIDTEIFGSNFELGDRLIHTSGLSARPANPTCIAPDEPPIEANTRTDTRPLAPGSDERAIVDPFPRQLSDTGCTDPNDITKAAPGLIAYDVNVPFWSNFTTKQRWFAIPDATTIGLDENGDFLFPIGSVIVKSFTFHDRLVETRLFLRHTNGTWAGYSYEWNDAQTDAFLVARDGKINTYEGDPYRFPSRTECLRCHTEAAGFALGPEVGQLNRLAHYPSTDRHANQLTTFAAIGLLTEPLSAKPAELPALPEITDLDTRLHARARAYLHSNCSSCHRPNGNGGGTMDLRYWIDDQASAYCDAQPWQGNLGITDARLVAPGDTARSVLHARVDLLGAGAMPPLAKTAIDPVGVALLGEWIHAMKRCP